MTHKQEYLLAEIADWAKVTQSELDIKNIYLFGSLVYQNGDRFDSKVSDIDVLIVLGDKLNSDWQKRVETIKSLTKNKDRLEAVLFKTLQRTGLDPICSMVVISSWELSLSIHKDRSPGFYCDSEFLDLISQEKRSLAPKMTAEIASSDALSAAHGAQKFRNAYLAISANGSRKNAPSSEESSFPKDLLRAAAQIAYAEFPGTKSEEKYDTNKGLLYLASTLPRTYPILNDDLAIRIGGRGQSVGDEWDAQLKYWEALSDLAFKVFQRPTVSLKDKFIESAILSNSFLRVDPWQVASSEEEYEFKKEFKKLLPTSNKLFDANDFHGVINCWGGIVKDPRFTPEHQDWGGKPFFVLAIQGALIDISYAHMHLLNETSTEGISTHLLEIYRTANLVLIPPPYAMSGPSDSTLSTEDAIYGNKCYATYLTNLGKFLEAWSPDACQVLVGKIDSSEDIKWRQINRKFEVDFILNMHEKQKSDL